MTEDTTVRIMRKHLYERVWKESLAHVGPTLGIWPTRLGKICVKNNIPLPGRGYWFYSTAARKTMLTPLPEADRDWEITFLPSQPGPPKPITDEQNGGRIVVPDTVRRPHRLIQEAKNAEKRSWGEYGRIRMPDGCLNILVSEKLQKRAFRIMDTLIKACEARDWRVKALRETWASTIVNVQGCEIAIELSEGLRQIPRKLDKWMEETEDGTLVKRKRGPYELATNGRLTLKIMYAGSRWHWKQWRDTKCRRLEDMLNDMITSLAAAREHKIQRDKERAEAEKRAAEEAERRRVAERLRLEEEERQAELRRARQRVIEAEQERVDELMADAEAWDQSLKLRAYINACVAKSQASAKTDESDIGAAHEFRKWVAWAQAQADRLDPLTESPPSVLDEIE